MHPAFKMPPNLPAAVGSVWTTIETFLTNFAAITGHTINWAAAASVVGAALLTWFESGMLGGPLGGFSAAVTAILANIPTIFPGTAAPAVLTQLRLAEHFAKTPAPSAVAMA